MNNLVFPTIFVLFFCSFRNAKGQNENLDSSKQSASQHETYLTLTATNICYYKFGKLDEFKYSNNPSIDVNLQAKRFISSKLALILRVGFLRKECSLNTIVTRTFPYLESAQGFDVNSASSITTLIGVQRQFNKTKNISYYVGGGIASKIDLNYKGNYYGTIILKNGAYYAEWRQDWVEQTTKGNIGLGLNLNCGIDFKVTSKFSTNLCIDFSGYSYFVKPVQTTKTTETDFLSGTTTESETIYDPNAYHEYGSVNTGGSNYFGKTDLLILIGLSYKIK